MGQTTMGQQLVNNGTIIGQQWDELQWDHDGTMTGP